MLDGVLVVDKPSGPTSHDVVARVRRALHCRQIGHTGTLDPMATGVLPLVIGRATRLARFYSAATKTYDATIRLGASTDTYDATGIVLNAHAGDPARSPLTAGAHARLAVSDPDEVIRALGAYEGTVWQQPPPFSAKKLHGTRAYDLARRGRQVPTTPVRVTVERLEILSLAGDCVRLRLNCSAGFYVRSLAHDLGRALGCGAYLEALRRERSGEFGIDEAIALSTVERDTAAAVALVQPLTALLPGMRGVVLTEGGVRRAAHGNPVAPADIDSTVQPPTSDRVDSDPRSSSTSPVRLLAPDGSLVAVADPGAGGILHPTVVLV